MLLAGPTGVGKTALSLDLAREMGTEIVNADSMQVYTFMDIGTAKPTPLERAMVPHHLLDVVRPDELFDAGRYLSLALPVVEELHRQGMVPLVVGGTGLYMKVLTRDICTTPPVGDEVKEALRLQEEEHGLHWLHEQLCRSDPELGAKLHPNDRQRILRALEVFRATGVPLSHWQARHRFAQPLFHAVKLFLHRERDDLYDRINRRVHQMVEAGLEAEVRRLMAMGYGPHLKSMQSLGYKEMAAFVNGDFTLEEAIHRIQTETRRYAKRQMTWFRADPEFQWFHAEDREKILRYAQEIMRNDKSKGTHE
jgi:tRNA dimethylallyltransferase